MLSANCSQYCFYHLQNNRTYFSCEAYAIAGIGYRLSFFRSFIAIQYFAEHHLRRLPIDQSPPAHYARLAARFSLLAHGCFSPEAKSFLALTAHSRQLTAPSLPKKRLLRSTPPARMEPFISILFE